MFRCPHTSGVTENTKRGHFVCMFLDTVIPWSRCCCLHCGNTPWASQIDFSPHTPEKHQSNSIRADAWQKTNDYYHVCSFSCLLWLIFDSLNVGEFLWVTYETVKNVMQISPYVHTWGQRAHRNGSVKQYFCNASVCLIKQHCIDSGEWFVCCLWGFFGFSFQPSSGTNRNNDNNKNQCLAVYTAAVLQCNCYWGLYIFPSTDITEASVFLPYKQQWASLATL